MRQMQPMFSVRRHEKRTMNRVEAGYRPLDINVKIDLSTKNISNLMYFMMYKTVLITIS